MNKTPENTGLALLTSEDGFYTSMAIETPAQKKDFFNALNDPQNMGEHKNETINVKHVILEQTFAAKDRDQAENEAEGTDSGDIEYREVTRIICVTDKGEAYATISTVFGNAMKRLFFTHGTPDTWEKPIPIKIKGIKVKKGEAVTFSLA